MKFFALTFTRTAGVLAGSVVALGVAQTFAAGTPPALDAFPVFDSYIKVTGQSPWVSGSNSAYARRFQKPADGAYGIEALHFSKDMANDVSVEFNGRALSGSEDYLGQMKLVKNELGSVDFGYKRFRTFYDGIGGFFPLNNSFRELGNPELHTDRAKFWSTLKIARPDRPEFELSYTNELRNGRKDTTILGDTDYTGIPIWTQSSLNPYSAARKLVPAYIDLNERQENLVALMKHSVGETKLEFEIAYNRNHSLDTRWVNRYPDELKPNPAIPSSPASIIPPALANNPNYGYDAQGTQSNIWTYTGKFETKLNEKITVYGGISYQEANADISGDRQITLDVKANNGTVISAVGGYGTFSTRPPYSYTTAAGKTDENTLTANLGTSYQPTKDLSVNLALKAEKIDMHGYNSVNYINNLINLATGSVTPVIVPANNTSTRDEKSWVPELNVRYTGIKNVSLYGAFDYRYSPGDESGVSGNVGTNAVPAVTSSSDNVKLNHGHYKVGANWNINPVITVRSEIFYKDHKNSLTGYGVSAGSRYILGYQFQGEKLTVVAKPVPQLSFTTRYVHQRGSTDTTVDFGQSYDAMDSTNHLLGETIDWNPCKQVFVQANLNVVYATMSTAYPRAGGTANDVLRNADNNYVNGSVVTGFAVTKRTDATLEYTFYRADNYDPSIVASVPYGAGVKEYTVTAGVKQKITDRLIGQLKAGYFHSRSDTTGGYANFHGPMAYVSLDYAL